MNYLLLSLTALVPIFVIMICFTWADCWGRKPRRERKD